MLGPLDKSEAGGEHWDMFIHTYTHSRTSLYAPKTLSKMGSNLWEALNTPTDERIRGCFSTEAEGMEDSLHKTLKQL